ncbi:MAG: cell division topological specificity factor MinE [Clostridiales bacterium]|nr:cell division topological specificity factor MinE [Clostridiales bacterium]
MFDFFRFFGKEESKSKNIAKERLKLVLIHDRANVSPMFLDTIKEDMIKVISSYIEFDADEMDVRITKVQDGENDYTSTLVANIPIKRMKKIGKNDR